MHIEQIVEKKKIVRSDTVLFILVVSSLLTALFLLSYVQYALKWISAPLQFILFALILIGCYVIITMHLTSFRYVFSETMLTVYKTVGKREKPVERVLFREMRYILPYEKALLQGKCSTHALYGGRRKRATVVAFMRQDTLYWLLISPNEELRAALERECLCFTGGAEHEEGEL